MRTIQGQKSKAGKRRFNLYQPEKLSKLVEAELQHQLKREIQAKSFSTNARSDFETRRREFFMKKLTSCCDRKAQGASAQSFALWQQATLEITLSLLVCSTYSIYECYSLHFPFVVNRACAD